MKKEYVSNGTIPKKRYYTKIQAELDEFMSRPETTMTLLWEPGDSYKSAHSMYTSYRGAVKRSGHPIDVCRRNGVVYLTKLV